MINLSSENTKMALLAAAGVVVLTGTVYNFGYLKSFFVKSEPKSEIDETEMDIIQTNTNEESSNLVEVSEPVKDTETKVDEQINTDE